MRLSLIKGNQIYDLILPNNLEGSYWISDEDNNGIRKNIISIEAVDNNWCIISNKEYYLVENNIIQEKMPLVPFKFYEIENKNTKTRNILYCSLVKATYNYYKVTSLLEKGIYIGSDKKDTIYYKPLEKNSAYIVLENNTLYVIDNKCKYGVYVNKVRVNGKQELKLGDICFIMGLQFYVIKMYENNVQVFYLAVNTSNNNNISVMNVPSINLIYKNSEFEELEEDLDIPLYEEKDYFYRNPRFINHLTNVDVKIDAPPQKQEEQEQSALLTIGPMVTMSMTSLLSGFTAFNNLSSGKTSFDQALPSLVMCGAMVASTFVWPIFTSKYQKRQRKKQEKKRQKKYSAYIEQKRNLIIDTKRKQSEILNSSFPGTKYCEETILNKYTNLWQKRIEDEDYLKINLGTGDYPAAIKIQFPEESFSLEEDNLKQLLSKVGNEPRILSGVPITLSLIDNYKCGIIGEPILTGEYFRRMLIQILAFHSYEDLKIVVLTDENSEYQWKFLKDTPHCFSDDRSIRFFATNNDEYKEVCYYLERVYNTRKDEKKGTPIVPVKELDKIYLIITDNFKKVRDFDILDDILDSKENYGFSLIVIDKKIINLPEECKTIISVNKDVGELKTIDNFIEGIKFTIDFSGSINFDDCTKRLANIPIDIDSNDEGQLPNKIGFLEMYDVGKVEQLNSLSRWKNNNPILNLQVPVGVGKNGEFINIDLHEKYHGPHGLIAGMTGSGKSEFIITYILSMAVNYHPYEVQFILIDYKGGGLAGAFENKSTGLKLPHLVGTITNLDANEINRSLASIESELKRRQAIFNKAREISGESTIDIYKYQKMYRNGQIDEPVSHLFIISDEFAELKSQQPEFMDQLISTARIGRSLGVHLILATQKPSGVVDAQIWSNTRFRVCMRVQETSDSNEVIKCPDAAYLKQTGRFYFQVGYNEIFVLGQASYAGGKYFPEEKVKKEIDTSIQFINNISYITKQVDTKVKKGEVKAQGEELSNVVKYLDNIAKGQNIKCRPLWLEKIPADIRVDNLIIKYNYQKEDFVINPVIGEYDVPFMQEQRLLTVPISKEGNFLLYGMSGSGKELFVTTLLYSLITTYTPKEIGIYILDFGTEVLNNFVDSSHVGDVIHSGEDEKIENLFKFVKSEIEFRQKKFASYNGNYESFIKDSEEKMPNLIIVINSFDVFAELYNELSEKMYEITRDCNKYGIYFVVSALSTNSIRSKLLQTFKTIYTLQLNNEFDYRSLYGNTDGIVPSKNYGRGLFKNGKVLEFQTAYAFDSEELYKNILATSIKSFMTYKTKMKPIPVLPKIIKLNDINKGQIGLNFIPVGMVKENLGIGRIKLNDSLSYFISFRNFDENMAFVGRFLKIIDLAEITTYVFDTKYIFENCHLNKSYYFNNGFSDIISKLNDFVNQVEEVIKNNNNNIKSIKSVKPVLCVIIGFDKFINILSKEDKDKFINILSKSKESLKVHFIFIDIPSGFKPYEFESWYKSSVNFSSGLWVGDGFAEQYLIKPTKTIQKYYDLIGDNYGYIVENGQVKFIKMLEEI